MKISVVMPCYKEGENLKDILPRIKEVLNSISSCDDSEILCIDTMESMDDTEAVCKKNADNFTIKCIKRRGSNSYGQAIRTGIEEAQGKYIVIMDADGSHNPKDIKRLVESIEMGKYDIVIGSRYMKGGETDNNFVLIFMSYILNVTYRILFGLNVKDVSDSFRIYDASKIKSISLSCDNFDIVEEILIRLKNKYEDFSVHEIPIRFNKRVYGESKRDLVKFMFSYLGTIRRLKKLQGED